MTGRGPEVGFYCEECDRYSSWSLPFAEGDGLCGHCGRPNPPAAAGAAAPPSADALDPPPLASCLQCGNAELYTKKDTPQQIGCAVVLGSIALSTAAYAIWDFPGAFAVFASVALLDFLLYRRLGFVTVCYRCHAEFRRFAPNPGHGDFDMHRAEEYEADTR